ncbi:hypothetical protein SSPO_029280 [Streptomyces antimycoticus]|uniref:Uncharacterized protein n=1 Tax=Streptomyces antimycoticus TaxID=68175 RepID=A0A499UIW0_9ACTN|nr:hypothetical protein SSPO_029280 [Streptomyces antimycoticus]
MIHSVDGPVKTLRPVLHTHLADAPTPPGRSGTPAVTGADSKRKPAVGVTGDR